MNDFDDDRLRAELTRRSGRSVSTASAHQAVLDRSGQLRRRRAVAGSGALVVLVVGGLLLLPRGDGDTLAPADTGQPIPSVDDVDVDVDGTSDLEVTAPTEPDRAAAPTVASVATTVEVAPTTAEVAPTTTLTDDDGADSPGDTTPTQAPVTAPPSSTTLPAGSPTTTAAEAVSPTTSSPTTTPPSGAPFTRTYDSLGGSITVDWDGSAFTLMSVAPAAGFDAEIEDQERTRIRVRFRGEDDDSRIETRVDNGQLRVDIS